MTAPFIEYECQDGIVVLTIEPPRAAQCPV